MGTGEIFLEGSGFSQCQSSWEEGNSGIGKEDSRSMPQTKVNRKLPLLFHFTVEVGCESWGEWEGPRVLLLWGGDLVIASS